MKVSSLIDVLNKIMEKLGDIPVYVADDNGRIDTVTSLPSVIVTKNDDKNCVVIM